MSSVFHIRTMPSWLPVMMTWLVSHAGPSITQQQVMAPSGPQAVVMLARGRPLTFHRDRWAPAQETIVPEMSLMAIAETPSWWAGRRATWVRWSRSHRMQVQSWEPLTRRLKVTDAARHVTACVCPYKAWGQGTNHRLCEGALIQLLRDAPPF